jgi:hypothetical protein
LTDSALLFLLHIATAIITAMMLAIVAGKPTPKAMISLSERFDEECAVEFVFRGSKEARNEAANVTLLAGTWT